MSIRTRGLAPLLVGLALALALPTGLAGCQKGNELSEKEVQQVKQGPPPEMPAEARQVMEGIGRDQRAATPPRPKGQPGPGAPFAPK
jgi:hypothetical protein